MDCREFGSLTKDFIFDDIKDKRVIKEYLEHARECRECYDELEVTYSMYRSLGDIMGPDGKDDSADYIMELKEINNYYDDLFSKEKRNKIINIVVIIIIIVVVVIGVLCFGIGII